MESQLWPARYYVIEWAEDLAALQGRLSDPDWVAATFGLGAAPARQNGGSPSADGGHDFGFWRHIIRIPSQALGALEALAERVTRVAPGAYHNCVIWVDAPEVTPELLRRAEDLEQESLRLQECGKAASAGTPILLVRGAIGTCDYSALDRFARRPNRELVALVSDTRASREAGTLNARLAIERLADSGVLVAVEVRTALCDASESLDACSEWAATNRLAGLLLSPDHGHGLGVAAPAFAEFVLRLYDWEVVPSLRLFPLNAALAALTGSALAPVFAADPLGEFVEGVRVCGPIADPRTGEEQPAIWQLLRSWQRYGIPMPGVGTAASVWLGTMAAPLYARLVAQLAHELVQSGETRTQCDRVPTRWQATVSGGRVKVEAGAIQPVSRRQRRGWNGDGRAVFARARWRRPRRSYHPQSLPRYMAINVMDLDITKQCNLRCVYCFKSGTVYPQAQRMPLKWRRLPSIGSSMHPWVPSSSGSI